MPELALNWVKPLKTLNRMCQTCGTKTSASGLCGCGTSCCTPWRIAPNCHHCPPPPTPPPCGMRQRDDGTIEQVWHPVHPLIPYLEQNYRSDLAEVGFEYPTCKADQVERKELIDCQNQEIAELLRNIELEVSTCQFGVKNYFKAIAYHLLARLELRILQRLFTSNAHALSSMGKPIDFTKRPRICNTVHGELLEDLKRQTRSVVILGI
jgi:hypothetical protein